MGDLEPSVTAGCPKAAGALLSPDPGWEVPLCQAPPALTHGCALLALPQHFFLPSSKPLFFCPSLHICFSSLCHGNILEIRRCEVPFGRNGNVSISMCHIHGCCALLTGTQGCLFVGNINCSRLVDPPQATEMGPRRSRNGAQRLQI